ncbi:MAG: DUF6252 family protein [Marinoscillum sp.]|uniref:DUF6252 family protein n=1 Tax=Marinoscillum sp. TaxID=2024838 RepID=UPI0033010FFA
MKTLLTFALFISLGLCISCDLGLGIHEPTELEKLPPLTTTGENTFGCLVNGGAFVVTNTSRMSAIYQGGVVQFGAEQEKSNITKSIRLILDDPLLENTNYQLGVTSNFRSRYRTRMDPPICYYEYENTYEGFVEFTNINKSDFTISGTFEFSTVTADCDTVKITDGRFDMQYIP